MHVFHDIPPSLFPMPPCDLQVGVCVELCSKYLETALTVYNCTDILNLAQMYTLTSTQDKARQFIMDHFEVIPLLSVNAHILEHLLVLLHKTIELQ